MKILFTLAFACFIDAASAQTPNPIDLSGCWKMRHHTVYERWDLLNEDHLSGLSYSMDSLGNIKPIEYLTLEKGKKAWLYQAKVLGQNQGRAIYFTWQPCDTAVLFVNQKHDFPKQISYHFLDSHSIRVTLSGSHVHQQVYFLERQGIKQSTGTDTVNQRYDAQLAKQLGADAYGMKSYWLVMLKTGSYQSTDKLEISQAFKGHMQNMEALAAQGKLIVAGPLGKNQLQLRGLFILAVQSEEEAIACLLTDAAIQKGFLAYDLFTWYGSAALPLYLPQADKIWRQKP